jgi:hypothetical protein
MLDPVLYTFVCRSILTHEMKQNSDTQSQWDENLKYYIAWTVPQSNIKILKKDAALIIRAH